MTTPLFELGVDGFPGGHFRVESLVGKETLSEAYAFDVVVTCAASADPLERAALGRRAVLVLNVGAGPRAFYGLVRSVRVDEAHAPHEAVKYILRVVPRLWLLKRRRRSRIFQRMHVPRIVSTVLAEAGIESRWQLSHVYPEREYTTQYEESDYHFVKRLLAEAGIFFYFPQGGPLGDLGELAGLAGAGLVPGDTVICADDALAYPPLRGDDAAALAASTAAAMAADVTSATGAGGAALGAAATVAGAVAGAVLSAVEDAAGDVPTLAFRPVGDDHRVAPDRVTRFSLESSVQSNAATFRDYDPDRPRTPFESRSVSSAPFPPSALETAAIAASAVSTVAGAVPGASAAQAVVDEASAAAEDVAGALGAKGLNEVYDHHSPFLFPKWVFTADEAPRMLRQARRRASVARGESGSPDLSVGHKFQLENHPVAQLDGTYALVSVEHRGETRGRGDQPFTTYTNAFECVPASMAYPPPRPRRKSVQVTLTATVVGPRGEDIYVDDRGQIRVQFHWDREGTFDDRSSCWIRTMQPWAGAAWGHQFIPRVGMEVVVVFEGGDPDKPMVIGTLYNGTHPPPFILPGDKTRSGVRTQSTPGGDGHNEISFQDAAGREQLYILAQRDLDEVVRRNHTLTVERDQRIEVRGSRTDTIENESQSVVKGDRRSEIQGSRIDVVKGDANDRVTGALVTRVEGGERRQVAGDANLAYASDVTTKILGSSTTVVGTQDKKRQWATHAEGSASLSGLDKLELRSDKELVITVGKSSIRITPDQIEILAGTITAKGAGGSLSADQEGLALSSKADAQLVVKKKLVLKTDGASIAMEKEVKVDGQQILLNSPDKAKDPPAKDPEPPTTIALTDLEGRALAQQRFLVVLDDASEVTGTTDQDGKAELDLASGGKITFPDLTFPDENTLSGPKLPYVVKQGDYLTKLAFTYAFDEDAVWNDPKNRELKESRKSGNLLHPGDVLHFPRPKREGLALRKGTENHYEAKVPTTTVKLTFKDAKGPFADEPYTVEGIGAPVEGKSGGDGSVTLEVPLHVREAKIVFTQKRIAFPVGVGDMDPINEPAGVRKRLEHLGYREKSEGIGEADTDARDKAAIALFQQAQGLPATGEIDDATRGALEEAHGS